MANLTGYTIWNMSNVSMLMAPNAGVWSPEVIFRVSIILCLMFLSLTGNGTLILSILWRRRQRNKRVNIFLVNLAFGDLMVCLVTMTTEILFLVFGEWVLGAVACKLAVYGQMITLASTTFLLTGMSIDRYQVIVRPIQSLSGNPKIWRKVALAWICAFIFALPQLFIFVQTEAAIKPDGSIKYSCQSKGYTNEWQRKCYFTFLTVYILVIPTIIMSFCYLNIIRVVWKRTVTVNGRKKTAGSIRRLKSFIRGRNRLRHRREALAASQKLSIPNKLISSSKRNVIKMTLSVILAFLICWSPYFIIGLIRIYSNYRIKVKILYAISEMMCMTHSALNPILYVCFSTRCRHMIKRKLWCFRTTPDFEESSIDDEDTVLSNHNRIYRSRRRQFGSSLLCCCPFSESNRASRKHSSSDPGATQVFQDLLSNASLVTFPRKNSNIEYHTDHYEMNMRNGNTLTDRSGDVETALVICNDNARRLMGECDHV